MNILSNIDMKELIRIFIILLILPACFLLINPGEKIQIFIAPENGIDSKTVQPDIIQQPQQIKKEPVAEPQVGAIEAVAGKEEKIAQPQIEKSQVVEPKEQEYDMSRSFQKIIEKTIAEKEKGAFDKENIDSVSFHGKAKEFSTISDGQIVFVEGDKPSWGYMRITFKKPVDLWQSNITFFAKGVDAGQGISVAITDINRRTSPSNELYMINLSKDWEKISISVDDISAVGIDRSKVAQIKIMFNSSKDLTEKAVCIIKGISLVKTKKIAKSLMIRALDIFKPEKS